MESTPAAHTGENEGSQQQPRMPETDHAPHPAPDRGPATGSEELASLAEGSKRATLRETLSKPVTIIALVLGIGVAGLVYFLQEDPNALTMVRPDASYEILQNEGLTEGLPIAIRLGPLTVFQISDPLAGGAGAGRARTIVESLGTAVTDLEESPGRVITIDPGDNETLPKVIQKADSDSADTLEIVAVTQDDLVLAGTEDPKLLARVWAERLTDCLRLLIFGEPPEFSRDSAFGAALDTLYVNAHAKSGRLTTDGLDEAFDELPDGIRSALTSFPSLAAPAEEPEADPSGNGQPQTD